MNPRIHLTRRRNSLDENFTRMLDWKKHPKRRLHESMSDWAEREVELACKKEDGYDASCYKSALKAFRSLCDDGHSGCSIGITKSILNRLIDGKPLTAIEDTPEGWVECGLGDEGKAVYQNSRMPGLFKEVYPDGTITYNDIDRAVLIEIADDGTETSWHSGLASKLVDEIIRPISLPYYPKAKPYKVYARRFDHVNAGPGCFDTTHILKVVDPDGNAISDERFYKETADGMAEIGMEEYIGREAAYYAALEGK